MRCDEKSLLDRINMSQQAGGSLVEKKRRKLELVEILLIL